MIYVGRLPERGDIMIVAGNYGEVILLPISAGRDISKADDQLEETVRSIYIVQFVHTSELLRI